MMSRKKRRGIIEKRRRDRINTSLSELRRLVPTAYEKQGSAKLEKAEILQMTVDHLKMLHSKGLDALAYDPSKFAMDYHNIGFRECAAEVARYLVSVEGLDIQDPLRLRLMSHLQCFATQREFASKQPTSAWYPSTNAPAAGAIPTMPGPTPNINPSHNYHQSGSSLSPIANSHSHHSHISAPPPPPPPPPIIHPPPILPIGAGSISGPAGLQHHNNSSLNNSSSSSGSSLNSSNNNSHSLNNSYENGTTTLESTPSSSSSGNGQQLSAAASSTSTLTPLTTVSSISGNDGYHQNYHQHHQHHASMELSPYTTAHHHLAGIHQHHNMHLQQQTHHHPYSQPGNDPSGVSSQMKPYRPWGAELAY